MHKSDIKILKILIQNQCTSELKSMSIFQLLKNLDYCYSKVHNTLNSLTVAELVSKGFKDSRADTYFITKKGIEKLRGLCA